MRDFFSSKRTWLPFLVAAAFSLVQATGRTQDRSGSSGRQPGPMAGDAAVRRLSAELKRLRSTCDPDKAALVFDRLFPSETAPDPAAALKLVAGLGPGTAGLDVRGDKTVAAPDGAYAVFVSPEIEKNPSLDLCGMNDVSSAVLTAVEQWAGGRARDIRVRRSADRGRTWPDAVVLGSGRALTQPSLRQIADGALGLAFVTAWSGTDGDILFARLSGDLTEVARFPVALGRADQGCPALATDRQAYAAPYVYLVYGESDGRSGSIKFRVSRDLGASWSRAVTIDTFSGPAEAGPMETALAFDPERGRLHVAYARPRGRSTGIAVSSSATFGASWTAPVSLTPRDDRGAARPAIAAGAGTVVVVYETGAGGGSDIGLAYSSDSGRRWVAGQGLASTAAAETSPDLRAADGDGAPRFFASYVENGGRVRVLTCEADAPHAWTTAGTVPGEGTTPALGQARVLPMPAPDGGVSAGVLWTDRSADDDVYFSPAATVLALADLTVTPSNRDVPDTAGETTFAVDKTGEGSLSWTAAVVTGGAWLAISSGASGTDAGTIVAAYQTNTGIVPRTGSIQVTPAEAGTPSVTVTVIQAGEPAGTLEVTPAGGLVSTGPVGGPFSPSSQAYTLRNVGDRSMSWRAVRVQTWTSLSANSGNLAPGASRTVTVSINALANGLAAGSYDDTVTFMNTTNGLGNTTRPVGLTISEPAGTLAVSPAGGLASSGPVGGPFTPSSLDYTLHNAGPTPIDWTASKVRSWTSLSETSGNLAAGSSTTVTVSINAGAESLPGGEYADTVSFVNATNGNGSTTRPVGLTVQAPPGVLVVTPAAGLVSAGAGGGPFSPASQDYLLENTGGSSIGWTAAKTQGWTTLSAAAGTLDPGQTTTLTVSINAAAEALAAGTYADAVTVTNTTNGTGSTTRAVTLTVTAGPALSVAGERRIEKAWILQREYGRLSITVDNPGGIAVAVYAVHRRAGGGAEELRGEVPGTSVTTSPWVYNDTFLDAGTTYTYRVLALDALGRVLGESNEITI